MSDSLKSLLFAVLLCLICSLLLTGAAKGLRPLQQENIRLDRRQNILQAVQLINRDQTFRPETVDRLFHENIRCLTLSPDGQIIEADQPTSPVLHVYLNIDPAGNISHYIIPIDTRGLWGKIKGYLALRADGQTVAGFTVYQHSETPGLGGEIEKRWFQKNFVGKKIVNNDQEAVFITVAKGQVEDNIPPEKRPHYVDGISGATLTGKYLSRGLQAILKQYEPVSVKFRQNRLTTLPPESGQCDPP